MPLACAITSLTRLIFRLRSRPRSGNLNRAVRVFSQTFRYQNRFYGELRNSRRLVITNLKTLTDLKLDAAALIAAKNERLALVVALEHLAEVDRRKSFSPRFDNIQAYTIGHLGYDSKSAWRLSDADLALLHELRGLFAHKIPNASTSDVVSAARQTTLFDLRRKSVRYEHVQKSKGTPHRLGGASSLSEPTRLSCPRITVQIQKFRCRFLGIDPITF